MFESDKGWISNGNGSRLEPVFNVDMAKEIDTLEDEIQEAFSMLKTSREMAQWAAKLVRQVEERSMTVERSRVLTKTVNFLVRKDNAKLAAIGISYAAGLDFLNGTTMTQIADKIGVTRAAVSKVANEFCDLLNIPRSRYMKSNEARQAYSQRQKNISRRFQNVTNSNSKE